MMVDDEDFDMSDKRSVLRRFWERTVRKYQQESICEVDQSDISDP